MKRYPELETEWGAATIDLMDIDGFEAYVNVYTRVRFKYTGQFIVHMSYEDFKKMFIEYHEGLWK